MCGIAGIVKLDQSVNSGELDTLSKYIKERGPDFEGRFLEQNVGLVHRRLSIIDTSALANPPMSSGNVLIVFNGEIYNFQDIRKELELSGTIFKSRSDTEVILEGYIQWGVDGIVARIKGMFAMAIYDKTKESIFLIRDHFGKKPLYYYHSRSKLVFSSDLKSISFLLKNQLTVNYRSIDYYLGELSMPQPYTIWNEVMQVEPHTYIEISVKNLEIVKTQKFWKLEKQNELKLSEAEIKIELETKLTNAVMARSFSDVPFGCFLSGGVDSGLVVAMLAQNSGKRVKTFSMGTKDEATNEIPLAHLVAKKYDTEQTDIYIDPDISEIANDLVEYFGEPFADSSFIPTYYVTKEMRSSVKMALSGDGGDEIFGGYDSFLFSWKTERFVANKSAAQLKFLSFKSKVVNRISKQKNSIAHSINYSKIAGSRRLSRHMGFNTVAKEELYNCDFENLTSDFGRKYLDEIWVSNVNNSLTDSFLRSSITTRLLNDYLVKLDRASMKNSLEVRSPFLDLDLVNFSFSIPLSLKFKNETTKYLLKELGAKYLPAEILARKKSGFQIPLNRWIRNELFTDIKNVILSCEFTLKNFNVKYIHQILEEHKDGKLDHTHRIWALYCLSIWYDKFVKA